MKAVIPPMKYILFILFAAFCQPIHAQWTLLPVEGPQCCSQIWFSDPTHGYYSGGDSTLLDSWDGGMIMETFDGGISWDTLFDPEGDENYPFNVVFVGDVGYTSNRYSNFYRTENGGKDWELIELGGTNFLYNGLQMPDDSTVLIAGYSGEIFKITDNGENITRVLFLQPHYQSFIGMQCIGSTCYAYTNDFIFRSSNAGDTWDLIYTSVEDAIKLLFIYPNHQIMMATKNADFGFRLFRTKDSCATWDTLGVMDADVFAINDMAFQDSIGYFVGYDYLLMKTTDSGRTWVSIPLDTIYDIPGDLHELQLLSADIGFIAGYEGLFYSMGVPTSFPTTDGKLDLLLYPNPADSYVNILLPESSDISVFNAIGQLVYQINSQQHVYIDTHSWANGFYIAKSDFGAKGFIVQ